MRGLFGLMIGLTGVAVFAAGAQAAEIHVLKKRVNNLERQIITLAKTSMQHAEAEEKIVSLMNDLCQEAQRINQ